MKNLLWKATLARSSKNYGEWLHILAGDEVPLVSPAEFVAEFGEGGESIRCYAIDIERLEPEQFDRLLRHLVRKFHISSEEIEADIRMRGTFPIRILDCDIAFSLRAFI